MAPSRIETVAIVGVGLIGGSFGMALKSRRLVSRVIGIGRNPERLQRAQDLEALDLWSTDLEAAVADADLIYIATPVRLEVDFIRRVASVARPNCVITDAGSTKSEICRTADQLTSMFVGGHPMAGSELTGVEAAKPDLFVGAAYVLTPTANTDPVAVETVRCLATEIGSRVVLMDPGQHDRCVAVISHLPHLIAAALISLTYEHAVREPEILQLVAGSFRDMTRVASSSPELWRDICLTNSDAIRMAVSEFCRVLEAAACTAESGDAEGFEKWFGTAGEVRNSLFKVEKPEDTEERGGSD